MMLPSLQQIEKLHKKYAPAQSTFDSVFIHCKIVSDIAMQLAARNNIKLDLQLTEIGCMLHDIGAYRLYNQEGNLDEQNYIQHGVYGYELLKDEGYDEILCRFASCHTGVGLTAKQIKEDNLPLPQVDYVAVTTEEKLVMYADKFHSKSVPPRFNTFESYKSKIAKFGQDKSQLFEAMAEEFGIPDINTLSIKYNHEIK